MYSDYILRTHSNIPQTYTLLESDTYTDEAGSILISNQYLGN